MKNSVPCISDEIQARGIRVRMIGDWSRAPVKLAVILGKLMVLTKDNNQRVMNLAFAYTSKTQVASSFPNTAILQLYSRSRRNHENRLRAEGGCRTRRVDSRRSQREFDGRSNECRVRTKSARSPDSYFWCHASLRLFALAVHILYHPLCWHTLAWCHFLDYMESHVPVSTANSWHAKGSFGFWLALLDNSANALCFLLVQHCAIGHRKATR